MILKVAVKQRINKDILFDYLPCDPLPDIFSIVEVPFRNTKKLGLVVALEKRSKNAKEKVIKQISKGSVFTEAQYQLAKEISRHFLSPLGPTLFSFIPNFSKKSFSEISDNTKTKKFKNNKVVSLNGEFNQRLNYFYQQLDLENQNLILLPKIDQIKDVSSHLKKYFPQANIRVWHSGLSSKEKKRLWQESISGKNMVVIGTRDAIFLPYKSLKKIYLEDPTNFAYFEDRLPYYNAYNAVRALSQIFGSDLYISGNIPDLLTFVALKKNRIEKISFSQKIQIEKFRTLEKETKDNLEKIKLFSSGAKRVLIIGPKQGRTSFCSKCNLAFSDKRLKCEKCNSVTRESFNYDIILEMYKEMKIETKFTVLEEIDKLPPIYDLALIPYFDQMINFPFMNYQEKLFSRINYLPSISIKKIGLFTSFPNSKFIKLLQNEDWESFLSQKLKERNALKLPPFTRAIKITSLKKDQLKKVLNDVDIINKLSIDTEDGNDSNLFIFLNHNYFEDNIDLLKNIQSTNIKLYVDPIDFGI